MDRKAIIGFIICIVFYLGWNEYLHYRYPDYGKPTAKQSEEASKQTEGAENPAAAKQAETPASTTTQSALEGAPAPQPEIGELPSLQHTLSTEELTIKNESVIYQFSEIAPGFASIKLKDFKKEQTQKSATPIEMVNEKLVFAPVVNETEARSASPLAHHPYTLSRTQKGLSYKSKNGIWQIEQLFTIAESGYGAMLETIYTNTSGKAENLDAGIKVGEELIFKKEKSSSFLPSFGGGQYELLVLGVAGSHDAEPTQGSCEETDEELVLSAKDEAVDYFGFDQHYFLKLIQPIAKKFTVEVGKNFGNKSTCEIDMLAFQPYGMIKPGESTTVKYQLYFGPKNDTALAAVNEKLRSAMDLGWFSAIGRPLLSLIKSIYAVTGNYGIAIILLTICLKILFYPLTRVAAISMKRMQLLTPEMNKIKEKFKDDRQRQQREVMQFMAKHKVNPAKGCLPILPQIPVFIAFYQVLSQSIELRHAPFLGWIHDLSAADPFYISPIILGLGMFLQQKLTPNPTMDKTQEKIMLLMPIMFTFMMLSLPAGMVLYMITNTIVSILQQQWLNKRLKVAMPTPKTT